MNALRRLLLAALVGAAMVTGALAPRVVAAGDTSRVRDARAHYEQAVAHYNLDEFPAALAEFREAYRLKPDPSFLFNIAQCHRKLGENEAALDFYKKYLRSMPDAPNRADVERMIADLRARQPAAPAAEAPVAATPPVAVETPAPAPPPAVAPVAPRADAIVTAPAEPPPAASRPLYRRWWFWTAIGVVVAGGLVAGYVATRPDAQPYAGTLDPHVFEVR